MKKILCFIMVVGLLFGRRFPNDLEVGTLQGAQLNYVDTTNFTVGTTGVVTKVKASAGDCDFIFTNTLSAYITYEGTNGLDYYGTFISNNGAGIGTNTTNTYGIKSNQLYYVYLAGKRRTGISTLTVLISESNSTPAYPTNANGTRLVDRHALIGVLYVFTNAAGSGPALRPFTASGQGKTREIVWNDTVNQLATANVTNASFTTVSYSAYSPTNITTGLILSANTGTNIIYVGDDNAAGSGMFPVGSVGTATCWSTFLLPCDGTFKYKAANALSACTLYLRGLRYELP